MRREGRGSIRGDVERGRLLSLRPGQVALSFGVLAMLVALLATSWVSVEAHDNELQGLFSEEADGTAMTFAQRESFGVVLEIDDWSRGDASAREVQIARALLGQRLQVVTASGRSTYDLTDAPYRAALERVDDAIRALDDTPLDERIATRGELDPVLDEFETRSRELSAIFQELTRERAVAAIESRAIVEQLQGILAAVIVIAGVALAGWLAADLRVAYRRASVRLLAETRRLKSARRRLEFREQLQERARAWTDAVTSGSTTAEIARSMRADLGRLLAGSDVALVDDGSGRFRFAAAPRTGAAADDADIGRLARTDVDAALDRANEILSVAWTRDHREEVFALERQHDALTGLPNRERLGPVIADALAEAAIQHSGGVVGLALVDIDRFADFNSSFGHVEGDRLLVEMARRLVSLCGDDHAVLRLSADEFAVVGAFDSEARARDEIESLTAALSFSRAVGEETAAIAVTVGAVVSRSLQAGPESLIQRAAAALASAQHAQPRLPVRFFEWERDEHLMAVMQEESALRSALRSGEFEMHFQPIIDLDSGELAGCEALVRWNRPGVGVIGPGGFLPAIERAGLAVDLGWQIIDLSLEAWGALRSGAASELDDVRVSINIDAAQLRVPTLTDYLVNAAEQHDVPLDRLVVEVTEHALLSGEIPIAQLAALRERGVSVALDDFGTGYSSLAQASSLPLDILKIDRSFLPDPELHPQQRALLRDILSFATTLRLAVTAEGVESASVADALRELGVDFGQGWHWARAMPAPELAAWLASRGRALSSR